MNANEYIHITYYAESVEDDYERGESITGGVSSWWTDKDCPVRVTEPVKSIEDALKAICEANGFTYRKDYWSNFYEDSGEEIGRFDTSFLVDEDNAEASEGEIAEWKEGKRKLWSCHVSAFLEVRSSRPLTVDENNTFTNRRIAA